MCTVVFAPASRVRPSSWFRVAERLFVSQVGVGVSRASLTDLKCAALHTAARKSSSQACHQPQQGSQSVSTPCTGKPGGHTSSSRAHSQYPLPVLENQEGTLAPACSASLDCCPRAVPSSCVSSQHHDSGYFSRARKENRLYPILCTSVLTH